jgi:hypothetical protein
MKGRYMNEETWHEHFRRYNTTGEFWCARDARGLVLCDGGLYGNYLELFSNCVVGRVVNGRPLIRTAKTREGIMEAVRDFNSKCQSRLIKVHPVRVVCELLEVKTRVRKKARGRKG